MSDMWTIVAAERGALADQLAGLPAEQWQTPSLCQGWTVEETLAHMTSTAAMTPPKFFLGFVGSGFSFPRFTRAGIERHRGDTPAGTLRNFRAQQGSTSSPPGPRLSWLGETIVHSEDIRRPLGLEHDYPQDAVRSVMDFYKGSNALIGTRKRMDGLTLRATDADWSHGSGPVVEGPLLSLLLAATGRAVACDDLHGEGVDTLRSRGG